MEQPDTLAPQEEVPASAATTTQEDTSAAGEQNLAVTPTEPQVQEDAQVVTTEATVASEEDGFLGGKYKTKEDFENAYKELKRTYDTSVNDKAELSRILAEAFTPDDVEEDDEPAYNSAPTNSFTDTRLVNMEFSMSHPDADGKSIVEIMKSDPVAKKIGDYEARLQYAYLASKNKASSKVVEQAKKQAAIETKVSVASKQSAQVETASSQAAPPKQEPLTKEQIRAAARNTGDFDALLKDRFKGIAKMMS